VTTAPYNVQATISTKPVGIGPTGDVDGGYHGCTLETPSREGTGSRPSGRCPTREGQSLTSCESHYPCPNGWNGSWAAVYALRERYVLHHYRNQASCSCHTCGNPRHVWKGDDAITLQEQRADLEAEEGNGADMSCPPLTDEDEVPPRD
jgi:hypothetical protein